MEEYEFYCKNEKAIDVVSSVIKAIEEIGAKTDFTGKDIEEQLQNLEENKLKDVFKKLSFYTISTAYDIGIKIKQDSVRSLEDMFVLSSLFSFAVDKKYKNKEQQELFTSLLNVYMFSKDSTSGAVINRSNKDFSEELLSYFFDKMEENESGVLTLIKYLREAFEIEVNKEVIEVCDHLDEFFY